MEEGNNPETGHIQYFLQCSNGKEIIYTKIIKSNITNPALIAMQLFEVCMLVDLKPETIYSCTSFDVSIQLYVRVLDPEEFEKLATNVSSFFKKRIRDFKVEYLQNLPQKE